jgi:hypothetical protein
MTERIDSEQEDQEEVVEEEQLDAEPQEQEPEPTLEDEIELMSAEEAREFAKKALSTRRSANAEAASASKKAREAAEELKQIKADQAKAKRDAEIAAMDKEDQIQAKLADAEERAALAERKALKQTKVNEAIGYATKLKFHNPGRAAQNIDVDSDVPVEDQIRQLAEDEPYMVEAPKKRVFTQPADPPAANSGGQRNSIEHLRTNKAVALEKAHKAYQESMQETGRNAALNQAVAWRRIAELDPDFGSGKAMEDAMISQGRKDRSEGG